MARMASGILRRFGGRKLAVDVRLVVCLCGRLSAEVFRLATIGARMDEASPNAFGRSPGVTAEQASNVHQAPLPVTATVPLFLATRKKRPSAHRQIRARTAA
jgi:hypothetical protein